MTTIQETEERWKREAESLRKKLKWYAENQQLLDKDALLMKQKDEEVKQLKCKLDELSTDVSNYYINLCWDAVASR